MIIVGVDPGTGGAVAGLSSDDGLVLCADLPTHTHRVGKANRSYITPHELARLLRGLRTLDDNLIAYVERVHAMPKQGVVSVGTFMQAYGTILGVLGAVSIPVRHITPQEWKRGVRLGTGHTKDDARARAAEYFPGAQSSWFRRKQDHNRAEAALIAAYGARQESGPPL